MSLFVEKMMQAFIFRFAQRPIEGCQGSAGKAGLKSTYLQKVYYFASAENRARFDQEPSAYADKMSKVSGVPTGLKK